jgi:hypothetical protein
MDEPDILERKTQELMVPSSSSVMSSNSSTSSLADQTEEGALEQRLVKQVTEMFSRNQFLFSYTCDVTNNFQRSYQKSKEDTLYDDINVPLWKKVDSRFWWNEHLARDFITQKVYSQKERETGN